MTYPDRRFLSVLDRGEGILYVQDTDRAERRDIVEHWTTGRPAECYELVPAVHMDAVRAVFGALAHDEQIQEGQCSGALLRALDALPDELKGGK